MRVSTVSISRTFSSDIQLCLKTLQGTFTLRISVKVKTNECMSHWTFNVSCLSKPGINFSFSFYVSISFQDKHPSTI